jgi:DNA mismatch endonuclease (patch repair protein)
MMEQSAPRPSSKAVSARMSKQKRRDTEPELQLRRALHAQGLRFRVCQKVPGYPRRTIDIAFTRRRVAVFVDGCFWHACPEHATWPIASQDWWARKLRANVERDRETDAALEAQGWLVVRVWEHEALGSVVQRITAALDERAS